MTSVPSLPASITMCPDYKKRERVSSYVRVTFDYNMLVKEYL